MEQKYLQVKNSLEELGYKYKLSNESLPLVERLLSDLVQTTDSLRKYMKLAKEAIEERDNLLLGAEPYRCDNAKLVKECNDLHASLTRLREESEKSQSQLQKKLAVLLKEKQSCDGEHWKNITRIKELQLQHARKEHKSVRIQERIGKVYKCQTTSALSSNRCSSNKELRISSAMVLADEKIAHLSKEVSRLKDERLELAEVNGILKNKINTRDKEIQRLMELLQGGRPRSAVNEDCCYKNIEPRMAALTDEIEYLQKCKRESDDKFKGALAKQHEAMQRAMHLADRNKQLERELRDIDQIALTVEAECNSTVMSNSEKINRLQERMHQSILQIQILDRENADLKRDRIQHQVDFDALRHEKQQLHNMLESVLEEKRRINERLNQANRIEQDLNIEIDRLTQLTAQQRRRLADNGIQFIMSGREDTIDAAKLGESEELSDHKQRPAVQKKKKGGKKQRKLKSRSPSPIFHKRIVYEQPSKYMDPKKPASDDSKKPPMMVDRLKIKKPTRRLTAPQNTPAANRQKLTGRGQHAPTSESDVDKDYDDYDAENMKDKNCPEKDCRFEKLETERDFYAREYHNLMAQFKNVPSKMYTATAKDTENERIKDLEQQLQGVRFEKNSLFVDKQMLISKLQAVRDSAEEMDGLSLKSSVRRIERERDLLKSEISQLQDERNELRRQLKLMVDKHSSENIKLEKLVLDTEDELRKMEHEKQELLRVQGTKYSNVRGLEDQCATLREQLKITQVELTQQKAIYTQLKVLLEQTDRSLSDCQGQLNQTENELSKAQETIDAKNNEQKVLKDEINNLKRDIKSLRGNINHIDQEKDSLLNNLDDKTEEIAAMQIELKKKSTTISSLESNLNEFQKQINLTKDDSLTRDYKLKASTSEIINLKLELEAALRAKDLALQENRRLQEDLASCAADIRSSRAELDQVRRQVDDLKRQLQHYVAEVKRAEDLITQKEVERSEMLDHFRNLSEEATHLETNNHTLESEASQNRVQLSVALDHATELERKVEEQIDLVRGYERQMAELTGQVANLEVQLRQRNEQSGKSDTELTSIRDLCVKLDKQKDSMIKQLNENSEGKYQFEREIERLKRDMEKMRGSLTKEQTNVDNMEKLLAESRQDTVEQRLLNQELQSEVNRLKSKIQELQSKLSHFQHQFVQKSDAGIRSGKFNNEHTEVQNLIEEKYSLTEILNPNIHMLKDNTHSQENVVNQSIYENIDQLRKLLYPLTPVNSVHDEARRKRSSMAETAAVNKTTPNMFSKNENFSVSNADRDASIPHYETITSPVNDRINPYHNTSSSSVERLPKTRKSKVIIVEDGDVAVPVVEKTKERGSTSDHLQLNDKNEELVEIGKHYSTTLKFPSGIVLPYNAQMLTTFHRDISGENYDEASNVTLNSKLQLPSSKNEENVANSDSDMTTILSQYGRLHYQNTLDPNYDDASKITLCSALHLPPKSIDDISANNSDFNILKQYGRLHYRNPNDPSFSEASNVTLKSGTLLNSDTKKNDDYNCSDDEILAQYGGLHYHKPSDLNEDALNITLSNKLRLAERSRSKEITIDENDCKLLTQYGRLEGGIDNNISNNFFEDTSTVAPSKKSIVPEKNVDIKGNLTDGNVDTEQIEEFGRLHYGDPLAPDLEYATKFPCNDSKHKIISLTSIKNGNKVDVPVEHISKSKIADNDNGFDNSRVNDMDKKYIYYSSNDNTDHSPSGKTNSRNNDQQSKKFSGESQQLSNKLRENIISQQRNNDPSIGSEAVLRNNDRQNKKFSADSQQLSNKLSENVIKQQRYLPDNLKQFSNKLSNSIINEHSRKKLEESERSLTNKLNENIRRSNQISHENIPESMRNTQETPMSLYPIERSSTKTNNTLTNQSDNSQNQSSDPIKEDSLFLHQKNGSSENYLPRKSSYKQNIDERSTSVDTVQSRHRDGNDHLEYETCKEPKEDQQINPQTKSKQINNSTNEKIQPKYHKVGQVDKPIDTIRYRTEYARYLEVDTRRADKNGIIPATSVPSIEGTNQSVMAENATSEIKRTLHEKNDNHILDYEKPTTSQWKKHDHFKNSHGTQVDKNSEKCDVATVTSNISQYEKGNHFESPDGTVQVDYNAKWQKSRNNTSMLKGGNLQCNQECCRCSAKDYINVDVHFDITNANCRLRNDRINPYCYSCITESTNTDSNDVAKNQSILKNDVIIREILTARSSVGEVSTNIRDAYTTSDDNKITTDFIQSDSNVTSKKTADDNVVENKIRNVPTDSHISRPITYPHVLSNRAINEPK